MGAAELICNDNEDKIDGLCYDKCPTGSTHATAMPYLCVSGGHGPSYTTDGPGSLMGCKPGEVKDGLLCYPEPPPNYHNVGGVEWQNCPPGTKDTGIGCLRESYLRDMGAIPWLGLFVNSGFVAAICIIIALYIVIRIGFAIYQARKGGKP